jgi:hypothetical protein
MNNPYHVDFLKDFPALNNWLFFNGFSMIYSVMSFETKTIFSLWSDRCLSENNEHTAPEAENCLMLTYCKECKTVEVFARGFLGFKGSDGEIAESMKPFVKNTITEKIKNIIQSNELSNQGIF